MTFDNLTPMLRTWDLPGSIEFYRRVLGFECKAHDPEWGWASLTCGSVTLMFSGPNEHEGDKAPAFTGSLYFRVGDVDSLWLRLKDQARVAYPIETFEYRMREFAIYDNNGYLLQFGQAVSGP
ncbi:MAG: bleomycin resistance protein [Gemmatimonadales bacterium]